VNAQALIEELTERDIHLTVSGSGLRYRCPRGAMTPGLRATLKARKPELISALRLNKPVPKLDSWRAEDWKAYYAERAGIYEFDAHLPRRKAELRAIEDTTAEWLRRRPIDAEPSACAWCHKQDIGEHDIRVVEYRSGGNLWAHGGCWPALRDTWVFEADMALHAMGVREGVKLKD